MTKPIEPGSVNSDAHEPLTEKQLTAAAEKHADELNGLAPSVEEVEALNSPPSIDVIRGGARGSAVDAVIVSRWEIGENGKPVKVEDRIDNVPNPEPEA